MMLTRIETATWLRHRDHFLILSHRRPDGDTLGSTAALCLGLRQLGKTAHVLANPEITELYQHLHEGLTKTEAGAEDTVICVDVASPGMLGEAAKTLQERIDLRIDHHCTATSFTPNELLDGDAGACGEIIYDLLRLLGVKLDKPMAEALYTAVSTDTGCFRYANTTAHSFTVAAACAEAGGDLHTINQNVFDTNSLAKLKMQGWIIDNLRLYKDGQVAVCALPMAVEQAIGVSEDDMENISGFPRSVKGVKIAATLRQTPDGKVKISVRALPGYDASAVCAKFGGGGHKGAAGANTDLPLEEAAKAIAVAMEELF